MPVTVAVHVNVPEAVGASETIDAGEGPVSALVLAPFAGVIVNTDGATLKIVTNVELVTVSFIVAVLPLNKQTGVMSICTVTGLTVMTFDVAEREVAVVVPLRTVAVNDTVPLSGVGVDTVVHVYVIVPEAPDARLKGLGFVPVSEQPGDPGFHVPTAFAVGGLGFATMPFCVAVETFLTVITTRKLLPDAVPLTGRPETGSVV
ncbi:MAG TPA: hypothetical protein VKD03_11130 [Burkholderiales bacterium]|nr:hypothetical protein [Burkholderiales bacterium]